MKVVYALLCTILGALIVISISTQKSEVKPAVQTVGDPGIKFPSKVTSHQRKTADSIATVKNNQVIKKLESKFRKKKDEFEGITWYHHKSSPQFVNYNGIFLYFQDRDGSAENLRFALQYVSDEWLFIERIQFLVDGQTFEYVPNDMKRDNGSGEIWEWFDDQVNYSNKGLVLALAKAKNAKMKLIGSEYHKIKSITAAQIKAIQEVLEMYNAKGGA